MQVPTDNAAAEAMGADNPAPPSSPMPPRLPLQIHQNNHKNLVKLVLARFIFGVKYGEIDIFLRKTFINSLGLSS